MFSKLNFIISKRNYEFVKNYEKHVRNIHRTSKALQLNKLHFDEIPNTVFKDDEDVCNVNLDDVVLKLDTGQHMRFNITWLRDCCFSYSHKSSRQKLFIAKNFKLEFFSINEVEILTKSRSIDEYGIEIIDCLPSLEERKKNHVSDKIVRIIWNDNHISLYRLDWLSKISQMYTQPRLRLHRDRSARNNFEYPKDDFYSVRHPVVQKLWNVTTIKANLTPVFYGDLVDGFKPNKTGDEGRSIITQNHIQDLSQRRLKAMKSLCSQLVEYGLAKIVDVPQRQGEVLTVARSLAYERPTGYGMSFDVVIEPSEERNLAYSSLEFDLHSDLPYRELSPGAQLLHCINNSNEGGENYFSDAFKSGRDLREKYPHLFDILVQYPCTFAVRDPYRDIKFRRHQPMISLDSSEEIEHINYSPFMLPPVGHPNDVKLFYLAYDKLTQLLHAQENKLIKKMDPGDLFIFHNRRVLHGRSAYDTSSSRFLQGCYMDWDEIESLHEKLYHRN